MQSSYSPNIYSSHASERVLSFSTYLTNMRERIRFYSVGLSCLDVHTPDFNNYLLPVHVSPTYVTHNLVGTTAIIEKSTNKNDYCLAFTPLSNFESYQSVSLRDFVMTDERAPARIAGSIPQVLSSMIDSLFFKVLDLAASRPAWYKAIFMRRISRRLLDSGVRKLATPCVTILLPPQYNSHTVSIIKKFSTDHPSIRVVSVPGITRVYFLPAPSYLGVVGVQELCGVYSTDSVITGNEKYGFTFYSKLGMVIKGIGVLHSISVRS